jgi:ferredoxin
MPKVTFVTDKRTIEIPSGSKITDVVDEHQATLPFGCRLGSCGTCRVIIEAGMENLNPRNQTEEELFENFTSVRDDERLGCQLIVYGDVRIRC